MNGQAEAPDDIQARFDVELETFRRSDSAREELMQVCLVSTLAQ